MIFYGNLNDLSYPCHRSLFIYYRFKASFVWMEFDEAGLSQYQAPARPETKLQIAAYAIEMLPNVIHHVPKVLDKGAEPRTLCTDFAPITFAIQASFCAITSICARLIPMMATDKYMICNGKTGAAREI
ncbi:hypothetical protein [Rhizobium lusitanum]|uniref:hypothetical protein n=1 Tax=Rhizobium lusitanum TaxID=293958 RepID=UPI00160AC568|nr:hypothetical protein [Rhizobium lusitanum]